jgi:hypothetical protein
MSNTKSIGSKAADRSDWNHALNVVSRLAAARGTTLDIDAPPPAETASTNELAAQAWPELVAPVAPDQLARDMAEIEKAAAVLRRQEPALEPRGAEPEPAGEPRKPRSVWILIAGIWLSALLVVTGTTGAILLLLG